MRLILTLYRSNAELNNKEIIKLWRREKGIEFLLRTFDSGNGMLGGETEKNGTLYSHMEKLMDDKTWLMNWVEMKDFSKMNIYRFSRVPKIAELQIVGQ